MDSLKNHYRKTRIAGWDNASKHKEASSAPGRFYAALLEKYYRFFVPAGQKVLELGCGHGDLLAALQPSFGVGIDFSSEMISYASQKHPHLHFIRADAHEIPLKQTFDIILLSDTVNDLWDVQTALEQLRPLCHSRTRLVMNFFSNLWRIPLSIADALNLRTPTLEQNWLSHQDMRNFLRLAGFEIVKLQHRILFPVNVPILSQLLNRYLVNLFPFTWFALTNFAVARPIGTAESFEKRSEPSVTVLVPARNEGGHIETIIRRIPQMGSETEIVFVEGGSKDNTYETIQRCINDNPQKSCRLYKQTGKGKGDAVRLGFEKADGDILMILDADMTVPPEDLTRFYDALVSGKGEFINGVRLVYPLEDEAMRFFNILGNKFFSAAFSWLLGQPIKDTLCGTKVLYMKDYQAIAANRSYFGDFDPFGDFDLIFGAAKLNLKIAEIPIRYRRREYGDTNISRWRHGLILLRMVVFAARRIKFI
jgi:ubiquinone/menaquinone biosynthesis C-methylase UbiE